MVSSGVCLGGNLSLPVGKTTTRAIGGIVTRSIITIRPASFENLIPGLLMERNSGILTNSPILTSGVSRGVLFASPMDKAITRIIENRGEGLLRIHVGTSTRRRCISFNRGGVSSLASRRIGRSLLRTNL